MKTASYRPTQREVEASDLEGSDQAIATQTISTSPGSMVSLNHNEMGGPLGDGVMSNSGVNGTQVINTAANGNNQIIGRNRRINEQNFVGQTIYTVYSTPQVVYYKEMGSTYTQEDMAKLERVRKLIFEIKKSPQYGADIMRGFVTRNSGIKRNQPLDQADSRCLINLSNLFYDNLYLEEIKGAPQKQSYFILAFQNFVNSLQFKRDMAGNVTIANNASLKVVKVLFEG